MKSSSTNMGSGVRPFPLAGPTKGQRNEDAFMETHGGLGSRVIYHIVEGISFDSYARSRLASWLARIFSRKAPAIRAVRTGGASWRGNQTAV